MNKSVWGLFILLLSGCAAPEDKLAYLTIWNDKWQLCVEEKETSTHKFPQSDWFDNLSPNDRKHVFVYPHLLKAYECTEFEATNLKRVLDQEDITTLNDVLKGFIFFEPPSDSKIKHLDSSEIEQLAQELDGPFSALRVAEELGFFSL